MKAASKRKFFYYSGLVSLYIIAAAALAAGTAVVSVNCHNIVSSEPAALFDICRRDGCTVVTFMGKDYIIGRQTELIVNN